MQFRSLLALGFGASLIAHATAFAAPPVPASPVADSSAAEQSDIVQVASKAEQDALKKKKAAAEAKSKTASKQQLAQDKKAAKAKADQEKAEKAKLAKAKADKAKAEKDRLAKAAAEKEKIAKAKAEKDKQIAAAKVERDKQIAAAKVERDKKLAAAKAEREEKAAAAKVARAKAADERKAKLAQAAEERRNLAAAKARAVEEQRIARLQAEEARRAQAAAAAEAARQAEVSRLASMEVVQTGNNGELRSESSVQVAAPKPAGLFAGLFGGQQIAPKQSMLPETRALDAALEIKDAKKKFNVRPEFEPQVVQFGGYERGTIVIDTAAHYLYLVESGSKARRYAIAVGKDGLQYKGNVKVGDKQEWPRWIPTKDMQKRDPQKYGKYAEGMPGGGQNPLGARAIYLYENGKDTHLRIHGTIAPETIGTNSSNGCFRMINEHVMDLYRRVPMGTQVVVL